jgi:MFS family permease
MGSVDPTPTPHTRTAGWRQAVTLIALGTLPTMAIAALVAVLPAFFEHFSAIPGKELLVPMILTVPSLCVAFFSSPIGALADAWGRRPVLLLALVGFALFGTLPMLFDGLYAIIASRVVVGLSEGAILTVGNALMGDYFQDERRKYWLGVQMSVGPIAASTYIVLGGALGSWSWRGPFLIYLIGFAVLAAAYLHLFEPARQTSMSTTAPMPQGFPWRATGLVGGVTLIVSVVYFLQAVQHGRIFAELGVSTPARIGWIVTLASAGTVVGGYWYKQSKPRPIGMMLAVAFAAYGIAYIGVSQSPDWRLGLSFDALGQFGGGYVLPTLIGWALTKYDFAQRGRGMGIWAACFFLGQFLSPPVMTAIAHGRLSFLASTGVLGALCLVAAGVSVYFGRRRAAAVLSASH